MVAKRRVRVLGCSAVSTDDNRRGTSKRRVRTRDQDQSGRSAHQPRHHAAVCSSSSLFSHLYLQRGPLSWWNGLRLHHRKNRSQNISLLLFRPEIYSSQRSRPSSSGQGASSAPIWATIRNTVMAVWITQKPVWVRASICQSHVICFWETHSGFFFLHQTEHQQHLEVKLPKCCSVSDHFMHNQSFPEKISHILNTWPLGRVWTCSVFKGSIVFLPESVLCISRRRCSRECGWF